MTLKEIQDWIGTNNYVTTSYRDIDSCGNEEETRIFESNGKLYVIEFQNDHPYEKYGKNGYARGDYAEPREVIRKSRMVEEVYYENVE